jgi:hypothetical protein
LRLTVLIGASSSSTGRSFATAGDSVQSSALRLPETPVSVRGRIEGPLSRHRNVCKRCARHRPATLFCADACGRLSW